MTSDRSGPSGHLLLDRRDGVLAITLNRPRVKNAMTWQGWTDLRDVLRAVDPVTDRVVVLSGAGGDFCAGADLGGPETGRYQVENMRIVGDACLELHRLPVPVIARVDGVAVGAGMNLALMCDFVIASVRARFSEIFVKRAMSVDFGGSWILPRIVGLHRAKELVLLGDIISAEQAREIGLVHRVAGVDQLDEVVADLAARLAAGPRLALAQCKALLNNSLELTLEQALDQEARAQAVSAGSPDVTEALEAFTQKRPANFTRS